MKRLIDMAPAERAEIMEAWLKGTEILCCPYKGGLVESIVRDEGLYQNWFYALPPKFELDWSAVHPDVAYAEFVDGEWNLYSKYRVYDGKCRAFASFRVDPDFRGRVERPKRDA